MEGAGKNVCSCLHLYFLVGVCYNFLEQDVFYSVYNELDYI